MSIKGWRSCYWPSLILAIIGSINWGLIGLFDYNLVSNIFGAQSLASTIIYSLVGISGVFLAIHSLRNLG